jgi:hypothetical protein
LSIVSKDCARDEILVRARRLGDIEKVLPSAEVRRDPMSDYLYRAVVKRTDLVEALVREVYRVTYANFKDSVDDNALHRAYVRVWATMADLQPGGLFGSSHNRPAEPARDRVSPGIKAGKKRRKRRRPLGRGR